MKTEIIDGNKLDEHPILSDDIVIIVDVLRCSSTIIYALNHGYQSIRPVADISKMKNGIIAAEQHGDNESNCQFNNSPAQILAMPPLAAQLILKTTNGTRLLLACQQAFLILVGCLLNAKAVANIAQRQAANYQKTIKIIACGARGKKAIEDQYTAKLIKHYINDEINTNQEAELRKHLPTKLSQCPAALRLINKGFQDDIELCLHLNSHPLIPFFKNQLIQAYKDK